MIVRTPPPQRKRRAAEGTPEEEVVEDRRLVIYNDPVVSSPHQRSFDDELDHPMVCTYQCRQMVKSEFMDALNSGEKQIVQYQSRLKTLNSELYKIEEDKQKFQDRVCFLEQELAASKGREKSLEERLLKEVDESMQNCKSQTKQISELERQVKEEVELRKNAEVSAIDAKENAASLERRLLHLSESWEKEKRDILNELSSTKDEAKLTSLRLNRELEQVKLNADCAVEEVESHRRQLDKLRGQLNEVRIEKKDLEEKLASSTILHITPTSEDKSLVKHLQDALRSYEAEVQEARRLKSFYVDTELLKEKLLDEKVRRERAEEQLLQLQEIELNANTMKDEIAAMKWVINGIPGISSFEELPIKVASLQQEAIDNLKKVGDLKEYIKELEIALELANNGKKQLEIEHALAKEKAEVLMSEVNQLKQMLKFVTEERDAFRMDLLGSNKPDMNKDNEIATEPPAEKMESVLAEKDSCIKELQAILQELRETINHQHEELRLANERLNIEMKRIKSFEREGDRLRAEITLLESKLGYGDFAPANTKVLRMVNTLTVDNEAKHTIEALRVELKKTQAKLQAVEELKGQSDAGNLVDADISEKLAQLRGQIATLEKREERYKTVFADKISVFRRACCSLFGYKIVMDDQQRPNGIPVTRFTLQSIYAQTDDEKLEFDYESGNMNILSNDYTAQPEISQQVDIFIRKLNSIPAFTSNLTVESFNKRTLS